MMPEHGQVIPVSLAMVLFAVLTGLVVFNTSQVVNDKTRLTNAADSAVYSGLVWQSRVLNFNAYSNRAMVANQVSVAQAVSLRSWTQYMRIASENINAVLGSLPFVGVMTNGARAAFTAVEKLTDPIADALALVADKVNAVLSVMQQSMYLSAFAATPTIVQEVVERNDNRFQVEGAFAVGAMAENARQWSGVSQSVPVTNIALMNERADIINRSRDPFTTDRSWEFFDHWFPLTPLTYIKMHKQGGTRLVSRKVSGQGRRLDAYGKPQEQMLWEWKAKDHLALNTKIERVFWSDKHIEVPIGWGQAIVNNDDGSGTIDPDCQQDRSDSRFKRVECDNWYRWNRKGEELADNKTPSLTGAQSWDELDAGYQGIRSYRALSKAARKSKEPRVRLSLAVSLDENNVVTAAHHNMQSPFALTGQVLDGRMTAFSKAEVYFEKPVDSADAGRIEYANLYNPYWDVRLVDLSPGERGAAWLAKGVRGMDTPELASVIANPAGSARQLVGQLQQRSEGQLEQYIAGQSSRIGKEVLGKITRQFEQVFEEAIDTVVDGLKNRLKKSVGGNLAHQSESLLQTAGIDTATIKKVASDIESVVDDANQFRKQVKAEFERVKGEVRKTYDDAVAELVRERDASKDDLTGRIDDLKQTLANETTKAGKAAQRQLLNALQNELDTLDERYEREQALALIESVNLHTSRLSLSVEEALSIVRLENDLSLLMTRELGPACSSLTVPIQDTEAGGCVDG